MVVVETTYTKNERCGKWRARVARHGRKYALPHAEGVTPRTGSLIAAQRHRESAEDTTADANVLSSQRKYVVRSGGRW